MWLLIFPMKWSLVFAMKFFTASTDSIRNVYVCTVYHSAPCNSVCWQIFVDAILAIFVNHHTSEQWNTIFLKCLWDEAVETDHGSLSWSEMSLLQFNGDARVHYLEYSHFRSLIQYTYIHTICSQPLPKVTPSDCAAHGFYHQCRVSIWKPLLTQFVY